MPTEQQKPKIPSRSEADREIDRMLAESPWVQLTGIDRSGVGLLRDAHYEYVTLRAFLAAHPERKTAAVAERLDELRREFRNQLESFGLTPEGRRALGLPHGAASLGAQNRTRDDNEVRLAYRRPADHEALLRRLVDLGIWEAVGHKYESTESKQ